MRSGERNLWLGRAILWFGANGSKFVFLVKELDVYAYRGIVLGRRFSTGAGEAGSFGHK